LRSNAWWRSPNPSDSSRYRLCCFPHAGAGASAFGRWAKLGPAGVEFSLLQLPGRETRLREAPLRDLTAITAGVVEHLDTSEPIVLYGHSFGALVAFETVHRLIELGRPLPAALVVSGRRAPRCTDPESPICDLDDEGFIEAVVERYGGIPAAVRESRELMELLVPALRSDMELTEHYRYSKEFVLPVPILALGGRQDERVGTEELFAWGQETSVGFDGKLMDGGHFFHQQQPESFLQYVDEWLTVRAGME
jgi:medium-chain acyl-[acyl-carrier-protein] hydrolase